MLQVLILGSTLDLQVRNREEKWMTLRKAEIMPPNLNTVQTFYIMPASFSSNVSCFEVSSRVLAFRSPLHFPLSRIICWKGFSNLKSTFAMGDVTTYQTTVRVRIHVFRPRAKFEPWPHSSCASFVENQFCFRISSIKNYSIKPNKNFVPLDLIWSTRKVFFFFWRMKVKQILKCLCPSLMLAFQFIIWNGTSRFKVGFHVNCILSSFCSLVFFFFIYIYIFTAKYTRAVLVMAKSTVSQETTKRRHVGGKNMKWVRKRQILAINTPALPFITNFAILFRQ